MVATRRGFFGALTAAVVGLFVPVKAHATSQFRHFGPGALAMLHGRERVIPLSEFQPSDPDSFVTQMYQATKGRLGIHSHRWLEECFGRRIHVYVNGERINHCYYSDRRGGFALVFKSGPDGRPYLDRDKRDAAREIRTGTVEYVLGEPLAGQERTVQDDAQAVPVVVRIDGAKLLEVMTKIEKRHGTGPL